MLGFQGYEADAGAINSELSRYRSDKDNVIGMNKQLKEQAEQLFTTKNIENVAQNFGIVGATKALDTYGNKAYEYKFSDKYAEKFGARSLKELDQKLGRKMGLKWKKGLKKSGGEARVSKQNPSIAEEAEKGQSVEQRITDPETGKEDNLANFIERQKQKLGSREEEQPEEEGEEMQDMRGRQRPEEEEKYPEEDEPQQQASRQVDEDELDRRLQQGEDMAGEEGGEAGGEASSSTAGELGETASSAISDAAGAAGEAGEAAASAVGEAVGGAADAASSAVAGGLEAVGSALDATGVLAPIGFLLNIGGLFAAGFGVYEAADTIAKEIRGPTDKDIPSVPVPKQPKTMAQKGLLVTPHFNSLDTYGSVSSSW